MPQNLKALGFIAAAITNLDYKRDREELPLYSYPKEVKTSCNNSKPYHFWMSAYNARELVNKDGFSAETARLASFATEKAYQITRNSRFSANSNSTLSNITTYPVYSPTSQIVRTDLAYAAAGANYGSGAKTQVNVDQTLTKLMKATPNFAVDNSTKYYSEYKKQNYDADSDSPSLPYLYQKWKLIFAPNVAIRNK